LSGKEGRGRIGREREVRGRKGRERSILLLLAGQQSCPLPSKKKATTSIEPRFSDYLTLGIGTIINCMSTMRRAVGKQSLSRIQFSMADVQPKKARL
jgi:hypothetical protein